MSDEIFDFEEEDELTPEQRSEQLGLLAELIDELGEAQADVEEKAEALKQANFKVSELEEKRIPQLMETLNMKSFETQSGLKVKLEEKIRVGRVKDPEALAWVEANGLGGLIKTSVGVAFPREEREKAKLLVEELASKGVDAKVEAFVEWGTAASLLKNLRESGEEAPMEIFKASDYKRVKVAKPKSRK